MNAPTPKINNWNARRPLIIGFASLGFLVGGLGIWSVQARIAGAVVASGMIEVENNRQVIQHPNGGVVGKILAKDGDTVKAGDVVLKLDDIFLQSELKIIESQLYEIQARKARLQAERDDSRILRFPIALMDEVANSIDLEEVVNGQLRLFEARSVSLEREKDQLKEQIDQAHNQIEGIEAQLTAVQQQEKLITRELRDGESLLRRGLIKASKVFDLQRRQSSLKGEIGNFKSLIAQLLGQVARLEIEVLRLTSTRREEAITTIRDLQNQEAELLESRLAAREKLSRMELRSPVDGVIYGSQVFALGAVVSSAQPIMYVIPQDQPLVVAARIESIHIDQVHVGQDVSLRFTAFNQRQTPEIFGQVARLSADVFTDEITGVSFYSAELLPKDGEIDKLGDQQLLPGMPVESYIKTAERSPLSYLLKPVTDYFNKAFRES